MFCIAQDSSGRSFSYRAEHLSAPFASLDHSPSSPSWAIVSSMLDEMRLPFPLDRLHWVDLSARKKATRAAWVTRDELASEIARVTSRAVRDPRNEGRKITGMVVRVMHWVLVSGSGICGSGELDCAICLREVAIGDQLVRMECSHEFHRTCIEAWLRKHHTCPLCRYNLSTKNH
ncbi:hypothetical protein BT93_H2283 [Corymbia citriodora subsp. variegata]|nr:hypothetical protein BT93_H2283 [Corymbia citriodora subsp. variegata]